MYVQICTTVEVKGQLLEVSFLLHLHRSQHLSSIDHAWQQAPLPSELCYQPWVVEFLMAGLLSILFLVCETLAIYRLSASSLNGTLLLWFFFFGRDSYF